MKSCRHLEFKKRLQILTADSEHEEGQYVKLVKFLILLKLKDRMIFRFSRWQPSAMLDFFSASLGHPRSNLVVFYGYMQDLVGTWNACMQ